MLGETKVSQDILLVTPEDLTGFGIELQFIPLIVSTISRFGESSDGSPSLSSAEVENLVGALDKIVSSATVNPSLRDRCFTILRELSKAHSVLPKSCFIPSGVALSGAPCHAHGPVMDTWNGFLDGDQVCVKALHTQKVAEGLDKIKRSFYGEMIAWKQVSHPNVLPFLGVSETLFQFCIIRRWLPNGNIVEFIQQNPMTNRLQLLAQTACGLEYLHSLGIVHGGIQPRNILITEDGIANLGDFGIMSITTGPTGAGLGSSLGDVRYVAPELISPERFGLPNSNPTKESDIHALGVTIYETLTGVLPYGNALEGVIIYGIVKGDRPLRPSNVQWLTDSMWNVITACWSQKWELRWDIHAVYDQISVLSVQGIAEAEQDERITTRATSVVSGALEDLSPALPSMQVQSNHSPYKHLVGSPLSIRDRTSLIATILSDQNEVEMIRGLCKDNVQAFVDVVCEALGRLDHPLQAKCLQFLCKICGQQALLPRSLVITASWDKTKVPLCHGGFSDVWKGRFSGKEVAIKVLKLYQCSDYDEIKSRFCKEVVMWSTLHHPNVLPLLGVMMTNAQFAMVSEWMVNGNISQFVEVHPDADRLVLLFDIISGLAYLHGKDMVHGDLKGANILINHSYHACIADFGLLKIISGQANFISSISYSAGGTTQWMSPELLDPPEFGLEDGHPTKKSDIYALGMVVYEVLSGQLPFPGCKDPIVILKIMKGEHPIRPRGAKGAWFNDELWKMLEVCWKPNRDDRPDLETLLHCLEGVTPPPRPSHFSPTIDEAIGIETPQGINPGQTIKPDDESLVLGEDIPCDMMSPIDSKDGIPISSLLLQINKLDGSSLQEMNQVVNSVFEAQGYQGYIKDLNGRDITPQLYINRLDQIISLLPPGLDLGICSIQVLRKICISHQLLPTSYTFTVRLSELGLQPSASGECSDVWKFNENGQLFAAKSLRVSQNISMNKLYKRFCTEVILGKHIKHPNLLPVEGITSRLSDFCTVSKWMENGTIRQYIASYPEANHLKLLLGIICGLDHLHKNGIIHKNLRCTNILVDGTGNPCLHICNVRGQISRYLAPEHHFGKLGAEREKMTTKSDIYSLAMVIVELVTGSIPFPGLPNHNVTFKILMGERPQRPDHFEVPGLTSEVWEIAKMCWHKEPKERPDINTVLQYLNNLMGPERVLE